MKPLNVFLGYDPREHDAYLVAKHSIERRCSRLVLITPLYNDHLGHLLPAPIKKDGRLWDIESEAPMSTEFARTRFCVPFIQKRGWALFADSDIVCLADLAELFALADDQFAVMVVKHDYRPQENIKMDGQLQTFYQRKNWSSVILWNLDHPGHDRLSKERLNNWPGRDLHAFRWLENDEIGDLPCSWNHLVRVDPVDFARTAKILHYTLGGPWFDNWKPQVLDHVWSAERGLLGEYFPKRFPLEQGIDSKNDPTWVGLTV